MVQLKSRLRAIARRFGHDDDKKIIDSMSFGKSEIIETPTTRTHRATIPNLKDETISSTGTNSTEEEEEILLTPNIALEFQLDSLVLDEVNFSESSSIRRKDLHQKKSTCLSQEPEIADNDEGNDLAIAKSHFMRDNPSYISITLDEIRKRYYERLDESNQIYLDYTGASLYPSHLIDYHHQLLTQNIFGNPHSASPSSALSTKYEISARKAVLDFLDADHEEYDVIFTANASGGLKIVADNFKWDGKRLVIGLDSHNSVNGMSVCAKLGGGIVDYVKLDKESSAIDENHLRELLEIKDSRLATSSKSSPSSNAASTPNSTLDDIPGLAFFTGQSNITGSKYSSEWLEIANRNNWLTGLDASALSPTSIISLRKTPIDFTVLSIYKIIGYPTGIGCLIVSKKGLNSLLPRKTFFGGTLYGMNVESFEFKVFNNHSGFEDGTINFLSLPVVSFGLNWIKPLIPLISDRCDSLIRYLWEQLETLTFDDGYGTPLVEIRGPKLGVGKSKGAVLPLIFRMPGKRERRVQPYKFVIWYFAKHNISIRGSPCLCNPGAASSVLRGIGFDDWQYIDTVESGIIRVSLGIASNFEDCYKFITFCKRLAMIKIYEKERNLWEAGTVKMDK